MKRVFYLTTCAISVLVSQAAAQDLRFEFTIDAQISGSRPWDGSASGSSALDNAGIGRRLIGQGEESFIGSLADAVVDSRLDEAQATFAPPDPYLCIIEVQGSLPAAFVNGATVSNDAYSAVCTPHSEIKTNRTQFSLDLPENIAGKAIFGVALVDSDLGDDPSQVASQNDELIGFGLYVHSVVLQDIRDSDSDALRFVGLYERELPKIVDKLFGLNRGDSHALELEKVSVDRCDPSCRFGDATLTIKDTPGGW